MKLESTISERAGFLYLAPVIDGVLLLLVFFAFFGSSFVSKSGVQVVLPSSDSSIPAAGNTHIITVMEGNPPKMFFNESRVDIPQLTTKLASSRLESSQVTVLADRNSAYGDVMEAAFLALKFGYQVAFATQPDDE
ncbi:MAG: biopolymer transporter ExbD [Verrucomicrobiales bacterium]|nr:biopolymer transporter ExbD [Verrucomicrobiales bacterium]